MVPDTSTNPEPIESTGGGHKSSKRRHKSKTRKTLAAIGSLPSTGGSGDETSGNCPLPSSKGSGTFSKKMMIVSGGDGFEDFTPSSIGSVPLLNESAGRDDSTNHLLLWSV